MSIENALKRIQAQAAMLAYLTKLAAESPEHPEEHELNGMGDICEGIAQLAAGILETLDGKTLNLQVEGDDGNA